MQYILNMTMMFLISVILFFSSIIFPFFHYLIADYPKVKSINFSDLLLKYSLFFNVGCLFLIGFLGHIFHSAEIARSLGWHWSEFQYELAFSELSLAILGLLSLIFGFEFWLATALGASLWLIGVSGVHIAADIFLKTHAVRQSHNMVYWNVIIAIWVIFLCWNSYKKRAQNGVFITLLNGNLNNLNN